jgi:predicted protein tyrosine phosphatase
MSPRTNTCGESILSRLTVLSRSQATRYRGEVPYVVVSIRSPGHAIARLKTDPLRVARINLAFYDTTPEWEVLCSDPVAAMSAEHAQRLARFIVRYWDRFAIVVHCKFGVSRSAGVVAGILDAFALDASSYESAPYEPNPHVRRMTREALAPYTAAGALLRPKSRRSSALKLPPNLSDS